MVFLYVLSQQPSHKLTCMKTLLQFQNSMFSLHTRVHAKIIMDSETQLIIMGVV